MRDITIDNIDGGGGGGRGGDEVAGVHAHLGAGHREHHLRRHLLRGGAFFALARKCAYSALTLFLQLTAFSSSLNILCSSSGIT